MTYFVIFNLFQFIDIFGNITGIEKEFEYFGIFAMVVIMFEAVVYLAYYKDIIFASITLLNYVGMFLYRGENKLEEELKEVRHC